MTAKYYGLLTFIVFLNLSACSDVKETSIAKQLPVVKEVVDVKNEAASTKVFGIYSDMTIETGELSGIEVYILADGRPGKCGTSAIIQTAEGSPQYPELVDCCVCSVNKVEFESKDWGPFIGVVENGYLSGEFTQAKHKISLKKGLSFWQQAK